MGEFISFALGVIVAVAGLCLIALGHAMRNDKLPPNSWAGIRTQAASESESKSDWYRLQRAGVLPLMCLAVGFLDSSLLFILQGLYSQVISLFVPVTVFMVHSVVGIVWIYKATSKTSK